MNYSYKQIGKFGHIQFAVPDNWSSQSIAYFLGRLAQCQIIDDTCAPDTNDKYKDANRVHYLATHQSGVSLKPDYELVYNNYDEARERSEALAKQS